MSDQTYDPKHLPPLVPGSDGHAIPTPEVRVATPILKGTRVLAPWEYQFAKDDRSWHMVIELNLDPSDTSRVSFTPEDLPDGTPRHDEYVNNEVLESTTPVGQLRRGDNPLGDHLFETYGDDTVVFQVEKTVPVKVIGQVPDDFVGKAHFVTHDSEDLGAVIGAGVFILESAVRPGQYYFNTRPKFGKLYGGKVLPGPVPEEMIQAAIEAWKHFGFDPTKKS